MIYDLAIVGAGPGGLHAAKWAAKKGLKVILIEKRKDVSKISITILPKVMLYTLPGRTKGPSPISTIRVFSCNRCLRSVWLWV